MLVPLLISLTTAHAETRLSVRGQAERWDDPAIASFYHQGALMGGAAVGVDLFGPVSLDVDVAYRRMEAVSGAEGQTFELIPITVLGTYTFAAEQAPLDPFVGLGFALVHFSERGPANAAGFTVVRGSRPAIELRAGLRFDLGLVQPSMARDQPVKGVDLEVFGARRIEMPGGPGFDLAAWRGGLGLVLRL